MKKVSLFFGAVLLSFLSYPQLKVVSSGIVGIKSSSPNPYFGLTIGGNLTGGVFHTNQYGYTRLGQSPTSATIGSTTRRIDFWAGEWNDIHYHKNYTHSDSLDKENILVLKSASNVLNKIKPYYYNFKSDSTEQRVYGFMAQQIQRILPDVVVERRNTLLMDYNQIIPFLVKGYQELYLKNQQLEDKIDKIISAIKLFSTKTNVNFLDNLDENSELYQNQPNPFNENTVIKYRLPKNYKSASIMIFDMTGTLLQTHIINNESNSLSISANELEPGMYLYSLIVDDIEIDTKKMILQK